MKMAEMTPKSRVRGMLRQIFLRSRERSDCLKRDKYTCQHCGVKASHKKGQEQVVHVHHIKGIKIWDEVIDKIYDELLCHPDDLITLCPDCHNKVDDEG